MVVGSGEAKRLAAARIVLSGIRDPEIPTVCILDMGMLHDARVENGVLVVELLPTFSGCPAVAVIESEVRTALIEAGLDPLRVVMRLDLPWSTSMITPEGTKSIARFGILPRVRPELQVEEIACPVCGSKTIALVSRFGPTPCRAIARCRACGEPLEVFKPVGEVKSLRD
jgi:ring-1,2-phenylacetyl-CoA epoxidase subunit PaaD